MTAVTISLPGVPFQNLSAVNTIAALRLRSSFGLTQGENVQVNGGDALADGGGGLFAWDATSTRDDDGKNVIKPADRVGSTAGRWRLAIGAGEGLENSIAQLAAAFVADQAVAVYETRASLYANLTPADRALGVVYNDDERNGVYVKNGASGVGSWQQTGLMLKGAPGDAGASFYDIAVQTGYIPAGTTEDQFIATLAGQITQAATTEAVSARDAAVLSANAAQAIYNQTISALEDTELAGRYTTYAAAFAALPTIADGAFVQVLADETRNGHRTLYRKQSGTLAFVLDFDLGEHFYPERFGATMYPTRIGARDGVDSTTALKACIAAWYAAGGGVIWLSGWYRCTEGLLLPNGSTATVIGTQPPLIIDGCGGQMTYARPIGGAGIIWTAESGSAVAKIDTRGRGTLHFGRVVLASAEESGLTKPFVHTTFTTITQDPTFALDGQSYATPTEDGFILGGTNDHEQTGLDRRSPDCGFQGYGTVIDRAYFNGVKRAVVLQRYANAIRITNNTIWNTCKNPGGAAIHIDGDPVDGTGYATGTYIAGNLIEVTYYREAIALKNASATTIIGNDTYDAVGNTDCAVRIGDACVDIRVIPSLAPASKPYTIDPNNVSLVFGSEAGEYDKMRALIAGRDGTPNLFRNTTFLRPSDITMQEETFARAGNGPQFTLKRAADAGSNPGGVIWQPWADGRRVIGGGAEAGAVYNDQSGGAQWLDRGKMWCISDGPGFGYGNGNMFQFSGPGGNVLKLRNFRVDWYDHTDTLVGSIQRDSFKMSDKQVLTTRQPAIPNPTDAASTMNRLIDVLNAMRVHGLIEPAA